MRLVLAFWSACLVGFAVGSTDFQQRSISETEIPPCGANCSATYIPSSGCGTNMTCICSDATLSQQIGACVEASCTVREQLVFTKLSKAECGFKERDRSNLAKLPALILTFLAIIAIILRFWARISTFPNWRDALWLDDWAIAVAGCLIIPATAMGCGMVANGLGQNLWAIPLDNITTFLKYLYALETIYLFIVNTTRVSITLLYYRIFADRLFRFKVKILLALTACWFPSFIVVSLFQCVPVRYTWDGWDGTVEGHCNNLVAQVWAIAIINIVLDILTITLPIHEIWKLHMSIRKKFQVFAVFSIGIFVIVVSALRMRYLIVFANTTNIPWDYTSLICWSYVEAYVGIIVACLPAIRPLVKRWLPTIFGQGSTNDSALSVSNNLKPRNSRFKRRSKAEGSDDTFIMLKDVESGKTNKSERGSHRSDSQSERGYSPPQGEKLPDNKIVMTVDVVQTQEALREEKVGKKYGSRLELYSLTSQVKT